MEVRVSGPVSTLLTLQHYILPMLLVVCSITGKLAVYCTHDSQYS